MACCDVRCDAVSVSAALLEPAVTSAFTSFKMSLSILFRDEDAASDPVLAAIVRSTEAAQLSSSWLMFHNRACMVDAVDCTQRRGGGNALIQALTSRIVSPYFGEPSLKLLVKLFSKYESANFFFVNDLTVLIDIIVRQLNDLPAGHVVREACPRYSNALYDLSCGCSLRSAATNTVFDSAVQRSDELH